MLLDFFTLVYSSELLLYYFELHREAYHLFQAQGLKNLNSSLSLLFSFIFQHLTHSQGLNKLLHNRPYASARNVKK